LWLNGHNPRVFNVDLREEHPRQGVLLRLVRRRQQRRDVGQQRGGLFQGGPELVLGAQGIDLPLQPLAAR
jgi:hypothetical protein